MYYGTGTFSFGNVRIRRMQKIMYKRLAIRMLIGLYYAMKPERGLIDPFMIPFRDYIVRQIEKQNINIDELLKYMIENDQANCSLFWQVLYLNQKWIIIIGIYE